MNFRTNLNLDLQARIISRRRDIKVIESVVLFLLRKSSLMSNIPSQRVLLA